MHRKRQACGRGQRALLLTQAQGEPLLDQAGERQLLAGGEGLGFGEQVVVEVERGAHWIGSYADFCIVEMVENAPLPAAGGRGKQWPDAWA